MAAIGRGRTCSHPLGPPVSQCAEAKQSGKKWSGPDKEAVEEHTLLTALGAGAARQRYAVLCLAEEMAVDVFMCMPKPQRIECLALYQSWLGAPAPRAV